eukprot:scaffold29917_cov36-Tisochrysis_lutea.AAC.1
MRHEETGACCCHSISGKLSGDTSTKFILGFTHGRGTSPPPLSTPPPPWRRIIVAFASLCSLQAISQISGRVRGSCARRTPRGMGLH